MRFINLTPHVVRLNDGREFPPSGTVARCRNVYGEFDADAIASVSFGPLEGLPEPSEGTLYIASGLAAEAAARAGRRDVVAPATGHPEARRDDRGQIVSVPGFVRPL